MPDRGRKKRNREVWPLAPTNLTDVDRAAPASRSSTDLTIPTDGPSIPALRPCGRPRKAKPAQSAAAPAAEELGASADDGSGGLGGFALPTTSKS